MDSQLPPLILHPFGGSSGNSAMLDGSRAWLALQGLAESEEESAVLERRMLAGRWEELRMLLFLGKDIFRWLDQCVESIADDQEGARFNQQSFAALIVDDPPELVKTKLGHWGVTDRRAVFSRAIGIHSMFQQPPAPETLSLLLLTHYHRYADYAYICYQHLQPFQTPDAGAYHFDVYASEEYARLLSEQWEREPWEKV